MSGPGRGRYTEYVSAQSSKSSRLHKLFNANPAAVNRGILYDSTIINNQTDNTKAADFTVKNYNINIVDDQIGVAVDKNLNANPFTYFAGNSINLLPDTSVLAKNIKFSPANSYIPDLASPGANEDGSVNFDKPTPAFIDPKVYKPNLNLSPDNIDDNQNLGTVSPHVSSPIVGLSSLGSNLAMGTSKKS